MYSKCHCKGGRDEDTGLFFFSDDPEPLHNVSTATSHTDMDAEMNTGAQTLLTFAVGYFHVSHFVSI